jgi:hypothetical protein
MTLSPDRQTIAAAIDLFAIIETAEHAAPAASAKQIALTAALADLGRMITNLERAAIVETYPNA